MENPSITPGGAYGADRKLITFFCVAILANEANT